MSGVQTPIAMKAVQGFPPAIQDLVAALDRELDSVQDRYILPTDMERWSDVLTSRLQCNFDKFSMSTPYAITRTQTFLQELYPGDTELPSRLKHEVEAAKQHSADLNGQWLQFKMLYDGYLLQLEKPDREKLEKAYPELERACEDVVRRASTVVAGKARWERSFDLVLTDDGYRGCMETIDKRRAWTTEAFPGELSRLVQELSLLRKERARLSQEAAAKWDAQFTDWFTRAGDRVPVAEFCTVLVWFMDVMKQLNTQTENQKNILCKLNGLMRFAKFNTTTLNRPGEGHIPVQDIPQAFEQFEQQWVKARRVVEMCSPLEKTLEQHLATLKATRDGV